jgi:O-antigen/teichoic acid export membrane protein
MPAVPPEAEIERAPPAGLVLKRLAAGFRGRSFAADGLWVVATQIVGKGAATLLTLLAARYLPVSDFLAVTYLFTTAALLSTYLAAGLPLTVSRVVAEGRDDRSWSGDDRLGAVLLVTVATSVCAFTLAPLYLPWLLSNAAPAPGWLLVVAAVATTWAALAQAGLYGSGHYRAAFPPILLGTLLLLASTGVALSLQSTTLLIWGNIVGIIVPTLLYGRHLHREGVLGRRHWRRWPSRAALAEVLATTLPNLGICVIYASMNWVLARTLVERQETADQFNQYAIGLQWFSLVLFVPLAFGQVLFPKFVQKSRSSSLATGQIVVPAALTFGIVLLCALIGTTLTPVLSVVYGGNYQFSSAFVFTILLAAALSGAVNLLGSFVMATRGFTAWLLINIASALVAGALFWLVPITTAFKAARVLCLIQVTPLVISCILVVRHRSRYPISHGSREEVVPIPSATLLNDQR